MGKNGGGCVDVLMVQSAEKIRLSKWEEELPLPVGAFLYFSIFSVGISVCCVCLYFVDFNFCYFC